VIGGLILAAGAGRRFGGAKQLAPFRGRPLLQHAVDAQLAVPALERVVVVLGAHAEEVRAAIDFGRAEPVVCEDWEDGQAASLRCGLRALGAADGVLITLGDQPRITPRLIEAVLAAGADARAAYGGRPGHPVLLGRDLIGRAAELTGDHGARELLAAADVRTVEAGELGGDHDVDTPADLNVS
jgi:molybdenum cofactor cytidylyltransferase